MVNIISISERGGGSNQGLQLSVEPFGLESQKHQEKTKKDQGNVVKIGARVV